MNLGDFPLLFCILATDIWRVPHFVLAERQGLYRANNSEKNNHFSLGICIGIAVGVFIGNIGIGVA